MDIRVVETIATAGGLANPVYRVNPANETISLDYDETEKNLAVIDTNLNYNSLPWQVGTDMVKKVFLTYNGFDCNTKTLLETVVLESKDEAYTGNTQQADYNNSNEWVYTPAMWKLPEGLKTLTNPADYSTYPYDVRQGFTVVKTFLTAQANFNVGDPQYTAFYRAPQYTTFQAANVESNTVYTDGWYTSYVITCKTWANIDPPNSGATKGQIVFYQPNEKFYINLTGVGGSLIPDPNNTANQIPDQTNWSETPTFDEWQEFMRNNIGPTMVNDPVYFIESEHLVTADLNRAILEELVKLCGCCTDDKFGMSHIETWMKLTQKRLGAYVQFNQELFADAQCIIESTRRLCNLCLYHQDECLSNSGKSC